VYVALGSASVNGEFLGAAMAPRSPRRVSWPLLGADEAEVLVFDVA
jgi:hypothetical protein